MRDRDKIKNSGQVPLTRLVMVNIIKNGDMDLCARMWSGFMYKPRSELEGASS